MSLAVLTAAILADSVIDSDEINQLRDELYADGKIDADEINTLFILTENSESYDDAWPEFVAQAVYDYAAADGVVDTGESTFIRALIESDGEVDAVEVAVLTKLVESGAQFEDPGFVLWARTQIAKS